MNKAFAASLGDAILPRSHAEEVLPEKSYPIAGVLSFGRGLLSRPAIMGAETKYKTLYKIHGGQLIVSRLKAFEGAIAVVPMQFDGAYVSQEFPTFDLVRDRCHPVYLGFVCQWPELWDQLRRQSRGVGARRERVHEEDILKLKVPLPPIGEQSRIAGYLGEVLRQAEALAAAAARSARAVDSLMGSTRNQVLGGLEETAGVATLEAVAEVSMGTSPPGATYNDAGVGTPLLNGPSEFGATNPTARQWTTAPTTIAKQGDLLMSVRASIGRMNWADTAYCIGRGLAAIRPIGDVNARYLRHVLIFRASEIMAMTAGTTFPNLPGAKLKKLSVPLPSASDQGRLADTLDEAEDKVGATHALRARSDKAIKVLPTSILNGAFAAH